MPAVKEVRLINGNVIEIGYGAPVASAEEAKKLFRVTVGGAEAEWEYLSYFDFGPYKERGGIVNIRLAKALDTGLPRIQRREVPLFDDTQVTKGPAAAAKVAVNGQTAVWAPFYAEIQRGHMSSIDVLGAVGAGNSDACTGNMKADNHFGTTVDDKTRVYTTDYVVKQAGEGINGICGRSEYLNIPMMQAGLVIHMVGAGQSVYEDPEYRGEYVCGSTTDTYTRRGIGGSVEKPVIVTTSDAVMRHDSTVLADGEPARKNDDFLQLGYDFLKLYYEFGVKQGSLCFPVGYNTPSDSYRYDLKLEKAYEAAMKAGKWAGTVMAESVENYYIYGAMIHYEFLPESSDGKWHYDRFPVNTREELHDYDEQLYKVIAGIHGRYHFFTGNHLQCFTDNDFTNDVLKNSHPWFWMSQKDNYTVNAAGQAVKREPLAVEHVDIISSDEIEIKFNREIRNITAAADIANWKVSVNGKEVTGNHMASAWKYIDGDVKFCEYEEGRVTVCGGYAWRTITLRVVPEEGTLDNGKPYGKAFGGFTEFDIKERRISNGGWIADDQKPGTYPLGFGELVTLKDAIEKYGAGAAGNIEVTYTGADPITDWDGNALAPATMSAKFNPWIGTAYRTPLTGVYIYAETVAGLESIRTAGHLYDMELSNNNTAKYALTAGGTAIPDADGMHRATDAATTRQDNHDRRVVEKLLKSKILTEGIVYHNPGQQIADGATLAGGGMQLIGGYTYGHHPGMQPTHRDEIRNGFHVWLYVEGWGGTVFQSDETMICKDPEMTRYKNENLVYHEGGHGIDSFTEDSYGDDIFNDITAAWITAIAYENGRAWWNQYDTEGAYLRNRGEYTSTGCTFFASTMREQYMGVSDGTWTPINTREELYRYDRCGYEVFKRIFYNGDLGLYYTDAEGRTHNGDPDYRVIPSDWSVLRDTYAEFSGWTGEDDLIAWACCIGPAAHYDEYTGERHDTVNWVSWSTPNVWDITTNDKPAIPTNLKDFVGSSAYNESDVNGNNTVSQEHPFFRKGGVVRPERPAEIAALTAPVTGGISDVKLGERPVVVEFTLSAPSAKVTPDNAASSFDLTVNGEKKHFYFWKYEEESGKAKVSIRMEFPADRNAEIKVALRG